MSQIPIIDDKLVSEACYAKDIDHIIDLIKKGASVQGRIGERLLFMTCSASGCYDLAKLLIEKGVNVNHTIKGGDSALMMACTNHIADIVKLLVDNKANVNLVNENESNALLSTFKMGDMVQYNFAVAKLLIEHGANINHVDKNGCNALMFACFRAQYDIVKLIVDAGANLTCVSNNGSTAFTIACSRGNCDIVKLLIEKGANINQVDKYGNTPLLTTCHYWHPESEKLSVKVSNYEKRFDYSFSFLRNYKGFIEIAKLLLEKGADLNHINNNGDNALMIACYYGNSDMVQLLVEKGINVDYINKEGNTALQLLTYIIDFEAIIRDNTFHMPMSLQTKYRVENVGSAKLLIEKGVDVNHVNFDGKTALDLAYENHLDKIVDLLLANGAWSCLPCKK